MSRMLLGFMVIALIFSGCAVKQTDDDTTKVVKHVVNAPLYAAVAVGMAGEAAGGAVGYGVSKTTDALVGEELYLGETFIGTFEQKELDSNEAYAKFFQNSDFAFYKDAQANTYLYIMRNQKLIKTDDISYFKRWATANMERKPTLWFTGIILPDGVDQEVALATVKKDRFGNPVAWGNNTFITIRERRGGLFLTEMKRTMIVIGDGADAVNLADSNAPIDFIEQIYFYFPEQSKNIEDMSKLLVRDPNKH